MRAPVGNRGKPVTSVRGLFIALAMLATAAGAAEVSQRGSADDTARALRGAIDIHVHSDPDDRPRSIDAIDVAKLARLRGMRAIVLKNHYDPTAAVDHMARVSGGWGRLVWMSTFDAENQVHYSKENRPFVSVARQGALLPEVKDVISVIAKYGLVLATGHVTPQEGLMLLGEGVRQGVRHMVVTHAMNEPVLMEVPQMQEAAKLGAFIEFVGGSMARAAAASRIERFADAIRKI